MGQLNPGAGDQSTSGWGKREDVSQEGHLQAPDRAPASVLRVIYIVGAQHSGSTILEVLLQAATDVAGVGQAGRFYAYTNFPQCDCGLPSASCAPCHRVATHATEHFGSRFRLIMALTRRELGLPAVLFSARLRRAYAEMADQMFDDAAAAMSARILIDSSKNVARAICLADASRHDVRFVHLVRSPYAFITSREHRTGSASPVLSIARMWKWHFKNQSARLVRIFAKHGSCTLQFERLGEADGISSLVGTTGLDLEELNDAMRDGRELKRRHLFEPPRSLEYGSVRFDAERQRNKPPHRLWLRWFGMRLSRRWGY